ncbi:MAG: hypothetical protein GWN62_36955 [Aliifodinibius sp.]|nr:hypothetical protein [Fodinibius sp.]
MIRYNGEIVNTVTLSYSGETSKFSQNVQVTKPGWYEIIGYAFDPQTGNTGVDRTTVIVTQ